MMQRHEGREEIESGFDGRGRHYRMFDYAACGGYNYVPMGHGPADAEKFRYVIFRDGGVHFVTDNACEAIDELELCTKCGN